MTDSLLALLYLLLLASLAYSVGSALLRRIVEWRSVTEKLVFAIPVGMGVVSYLILAFGLSGFFRAPLFYGALALGALSLPLTLRDLLRSRRVLEVTPPSRVVRVIWAVLALLGFFVVVAALAPPTEWDALSYHLAGPKTYLRHGRIFYIPYDHHTNFPFLLQMLYGLMLGVKSVGGAKLCHTLCGALMVASVVPFARRYLDAEGHGRRIGAVAALILATTPMVFWEMTVAYSDLATAMYTWLALYALLNAQSAKWSRPWLILSAVLIGFALGTKFTVLAFWLMLLAGIIGGDLIARRRIGAETIRRAALWAAVSLAVAAPWYLKTWLYTGNPTYPFLYGLFGGRYWSAANAAAYALDQSKLGGGKTPLDLLTVPWQSTMLPNVAVRHFTEYFTFNLSPVYLAFLLALPLLRSRLSPTVRTVGWFGAGVVAFWFGSVQQTRYLIPALPAFALLCAQTMVLLWQDRRRPERWAAAGLIALTALWGLYLAGGLAFWGVTDFTGSRTRPVWAVVRGAQDHDDFVRRSVLQRIGAAELWINENTPPDAKVALFDTTLGFYLDRDYLWATPNHAAGLLPWDTYQNADDWLADFKRRGYTTLLVAARDPKSPDDGQRWRTLLNEAIEGDKVTPQFEAPAMRGSDGEPVKIRVFTIR